MIRDLSTFPWRTSVQDACDWKESFEKEAHIILANLKNETNMLRNCKSEALAHNTPKIADGYEHWICFNEGRIFSLKQILGELPKK
jgi:hypothetical protein